MYRRTDLDFPRQDWEPSLNGPRKSDTPELQLAALGGQLRSLPVITVLQAIEWLIRLRQEGAPTIMRISAEDVHSVSFSKLAVALNDDEVLVVLAARTR